MSMYDNNNNDPLITGFMTQKDLDFAKQNRERVAKLQKQDLEREKQQQLQWEQKQAKQVENGLNLLKHRNLTDTEKNLHIKYFYKEGN